jgi:23S rRNA G2445 N2-methylase RlmL
MSSKPCWNWQRRHPDLDPGHPEARSRKGRAPNCRRGHRLWRHRACARQGIAETREIYATDISAAALEVARINAARHQLESRIQFREGDLLAGFENFFDFIVSNPPYVGESEEEQVQLEVRKFEPRNAVFAGPDRS